MFLLTRRILFVFTVIFFPNFTWLQLAGVFTGIQIMYNYLIYFYPMEDIFQNRMEIFGEVINLILMYHVLLFTDFVLDLDLRYKIGYWFIFFIFVFISVHIFFLAKTTFGLIRKKWRIRRKNKQDEAAKKARREELREVYEALRKKNPLTDEVVENFEQFVNIESEIARYEKEYEDTQRAKKFQQCLQEQFEKTGKVQVGKRI